MKVTPSETLPKFYKNILKSWSDLTQEPLTVESILNQTIWYNSFITISEQPIKRLFAFELFIHNIFDHGKLIPWTTFKTIHNLQNSDYFKWRQVLAAIPSTWKTKITQSQIHVAQSPPQHTLQLARCIPLEKLTSKLIYTILIHNKKNPPSSQGKLAEELNDPSIDWKSVYLSGRKISIDSYSRVFHYKCSQNTLYLNKMLFKMKIANSSCCSYCKIQDETIKHLFYECRIIKQLWENIKNAFIHLPLPDLTPRSAHLGFHLLQDSLVNHIHLIFKIAVYNQRSAGFCSLNYIK